MEKEKSENNTQIIKITQLYLKQLSENEKKALEIATFHLESSFCMEKSNGFLQFKEKYEEKYEEKYKEKSK